MVFDADVTVPDLESWPIYAVQKTQWDREKLKALCSYVAGGKYNLLCLNDADGIHSYEEFLMAKEQLLKAFDSLLPERSVYEKEE